MARAPRKTGLTNAEVTILAKRAEAAWEAGQVAEAYVDEAEGVWTFEIVRELNLQMNLRRSLKVAGGYVNTASFVTGAEFGIEDENNRRAVIGARILAMSDPPNAVVEDEPWD